MKIQNHMNLIEAKKIMNEDKSKCKKNNLILYLFLIIFGSLIFFITNFILVKDDSLNVISQILSCAMSGFIALMIVGFIFYNFVKVPNPKLYQRVCILELIENDFEFLKISNNTLIYTNKKDTNKIIKKITLDEFSFEKSACLKETLLDLDNLIIIQPYKL